MSSIFSKPKIPDIPPPPPAPELTAFKSEITGIERVPVKDANGNTTIIERQILSDEQKQHLAELDAIAGEQLARIGKLTSNFATTDIEGLDKILKDFEVNAKSSLESSFSDRTNSEEENLAKFGLSDSTSATELRNLRENQKQLMSDNINQQNEMLKQQVRQNELSNSYNLYNLVASQKNTNTNQMLDNLANAASIQQGLLDAQNQYNQSVYNANLQQQQLAANKSSGFSIGDLFSIAGLGRAIFSPAKDGFAAIAKSLPLTSRFTG